MRVISGTCRGLRLISPDGENTRPTLDRVKEAVFSILFPRLRGAAVLDLFAGSGALGIEALSRGSEKAVFVDNSPQAADCIKKNLENARFVESAKVYVCTAVSYLERCGEQFDIIFLDPPYADNMYRKTLYEIRRKNLLSDNGIVVAEWDSEIGQPDFPEGYSTIKDKKYGRVCISILEKEELNENGDCSRQF